MDTHPGSGAASSLGRLTYAFCFYSGNRCRITGCEHLMQMECYGISLIFSVTQYDKLMLCFSHLVLMCRQKRAVGSVDFFKEVKQLIGKIINLVRISIAFLRCSVCDTNRAWHIFSVYVLMRNDLMYHPLSLHFEVL